MFRGSYQSLQMTPHAVAFAVAKHDYMSKCWCVCVCECVYVAKGLSVQLCTYPERLCVCLCKLLVTVLLIGSGADTS